jgi:hypothetical protein
MEVLIESRRMHILQFISTFLGVVSGVLAHSYSSPCPNVPRVVTHSS